MTEKEKVFNCIFENNLGELREMEREEGSVKHINSPFDEDGCTSLIIAVSERKIDMIIFLVKNGANIDMENVAGYTAFMMATERADYEMMEFLLSLKADINHTSPVSGMSAVLVAIKSEIIFPLQFLMQHGASPNRVQRGEMSPLLFCCLHDRVDMMELLLRYGAKIEETDFHNKTALHYACCLGQFEIAKLLIETGASVTVEDDDSMTPLMKAVGIRSDGVTGFKIARYMIEKCDLSKKDVIYCFKEACRHGKLNLVELIITIKRLNMRDKDLNTILKITIDGFFNNDKNMIYGYLDYGRIVDILISQGCDVNGREEGSLCTALQLLFTYSTRVGFFYFTLAEKILAAGGVIDESQSVCLNNVNRSIINVQITKLQRLVSTQISNPESCFNLLEGFPMISRFILFYSVPIWYTRDLVAPELP